MYKKNLFITLDFPPLTGGVATYISHICKNTDPQKIIVLAHEHKDANTFDKNQKYTIIRRDFSPQWKKSLRYTKKILQKYQIKHIHIHHILPLGYVALFFKLTKKIPYTIYLHGLDIKNADKKWHKRILMRLILRNAHTIIVNSQNTKNLISKIAPFTKTKSKVIYPCPHEDLMTSQFNNDIITKYKDNLVLLTVARLIKRKGHERILTEIPQLIQLFPNLKYIIIGTGVYRKNLQKRVQELNIRNYVEFLEHVPQNLLPTYYHLSDIFVMPTQKIRNDIEGFGISFLEANLFKKPVIGGANGGVTEAIIHGKTGFLINDYSQKQLFDILVMLLKNSSLRKKIGENGYVRVQKEFLWEKQIAKLKL